MVKNAEVSSLVKYIRAGKIESAFKRLIKLIESCLVQLDSKEGIKSIYNNISHLSSRYYSIKNDFFKGLITISDFTRERDKIIVVLLEICNDLEEELDSLHEIQVPENALPPTTYSNNGEVQLDSFQSFTKEIVLVLNMDIDKFSIEEQIELIKAIRELSKIGILKIKNIEKGSVMINIEARPEDIDKIIESIKGLKKRNPYLSDFKILDEITDVDMSFIISNDLRYSLNAWKTKIASYLNEYDDLLDLFLNNLANLTISAPGKSVTRITTNIYHETLGLKTKLQLFSKEWSEYKEFYIYANPDSDSSEKSIRTLVVEIEVFVEYIEKEKISLLAKIESLKGLAINILKNNKYKSNDPMESDYEETEFDDESFRYQ